MVPIPAVGFRKMSEDECPPPHSFYVVDFYFSSPAQGRT
jgi:hypothetical protein